MLRILAACKERHRRAKPFPGAAFDSFLSARRHVLLSCTMPPMTIAGMRIVGCASATGAP